MEAYPLAVWAKEHRIPFSHIRVILDAWDEPLLEFQFSGHTGQRDPLKALIGQLRKIPGTIQDLAWLNRRIHKVNPVLAKIAVKAVEAISGSPIPL
jgi:hypothetical protein